MSATQKKYKEPYSIADVIYILYYKYDKECMLCIFLYLLSYTCFSCN